MAYRSVTIQQSEAGSGFVVGVAERTDQADLDPQVARSAALEREVEVAEADFLLNVISPEASRVAALLVDRVCCSAEEWASRSLVKIPRRGCHHHPPC